MRQKRAMTMLIFTLLLATALCGCRKNGTPKVEVPDQSQSGLNTPIPTPSPEPKEPIVISMVGDCTLASSQYNNDFEAVVGDDYAWPFAGAVDVLSEDDFTIANLECSFSETPLYGSTTFYFCGPAEYANILSEGSVECATMGNNHTTDFGQTGIDRNVTSLNKEEVGHEIGGEGKILDVDDMKSGIYDNHR